MSEQATRYSLQYAIDATPKDFDAGLLSDGGGGNIDWWQHYIRTLLDQANEHWRDEYGTLQDELATGERQRDDIQAELVRLDAFVHKVGDATATVDAAIARIELAEKQRDDLQDAIEDIRAISCGEAPVPFEGSKAMGFIHKRCLEADIAAVPAPATEPDIWVCDACGWNTIHVSETLDQKLGVYVCPDCGGRESMQKVTE